ncbi:MAG: deoxyribose-phosphate aldolase [Elusimicrobia bacterium]|nr:deoxyribose-phosphate aldolase [Candidatus Liberimonas magnetica]
MKKENIAQFIDYTLLRPDATKKEIKKLCKDALAYNFSSVCVNPCHVNYCKKLLGKNNVKVCSVIGFPFGASTTEIKVCEALDAVKNGADELDMVINIGALKSGDMRFVLNDIKAVRKAAGSRVLKVIIETCYLTKKEKITVAKLIKRAKADFIKTSTGFGPSGANLGDIKLIRKTIGSDIGIKAAGGIRTSFDALKFINAGATRLGTSRNLVKGS